MGEVISLFYYEYETYEQSAQNNRNGNCHQLRSTSRASEGGEEDLATTTGAAATASMGVFMKNGNNKNMIHKNSTTSLDGKTMGDSAPRTTASNGSSSTTTSSTTTSSTTRAWQDDLPPLPWPQAPLLLRATSHTTRVLGVRRAYDSSEKKKKDEVMGEDMATTTTAFLPLNTGDEANPWAIDFETDLFRGTLMVRVKGVTAATTTTATIEEEKEKEQQNQQPINNYFTGKQRQFQVVITGQFLRPNIRFSTLLSGQSMDYPLGPLPGLPIVAAVLRLYKTLQPHSHVELGNHQSPYAQALSPLLALAQTVLVRDDNEEKNEQTNDNHRREYLVIPTEDELVEPHPRDPHSLFPDASLSAKTFASADQRRKRRKKLVGHHRRHDDDDDDTECCFDVTKTYTFDMYQHQLHLVDYTLSLASLYRLPIAPVLNGQPLRILATVADGEPAWSFELWHESLLLPKSS
jgi:Protein of unknown function (DUF1769)